MDALVIGATGLDVKGQVSGPLDMGASRHGTIRRTSGGLARNIAENLARMGVEVALISAVGEDWTGHHLLEEARAAGIDVEHVLTSPEVRTGTYLALFDADRQLIAALDDMAAMELVTPRYLFDRRALFRDTELVVIDANLSPPAMEMAFRLADKYDHPVCVDPTSVSLAKRLRPYLSRCHLLTPNLREGNALLGDDPVTNEPMDLARRLTREGVDIAVITLAEQGLCYATADESGNLPAIRVSVVDRTGVGDALTAGVIFGLLEEVPASEAVRLGLSAAALTIQCRETVCPYMSLENLYAQLVV
jgi:pseudouridine kinase